MTRTGALSSAISFALLAVALLAPAAAPAYEPHAPVGVEGALANPPGMPPPPTPAPPPGSPPAAEPPLAGGPASPVPPGLPRRLVGHGRYWGLSIVGANGGHPIRKPRELWLSFGTIANYGGEDFEEKIAEYAALFWEAGCNEHTYRVEATPTRFRLGGGGTTLVLCVGRVQREERWLERFFGADPHWRLAHGHLTLTARGSRIVMHHRHRP